MVDFLGSVDLLIRKFSKLIFVWTLFFNEFIYQFPNLSAILKNIYLSVGTRRTPQDLRSTRALFKKEP